MCWFNVLIKSMHSICISLMCIKTEPISGIFGIISDLFLTNKYSHDSWSIPECKTDWNTPKISSYLDEAVFNMGLFSTVYYTVKFIKTLLNAKLFLVSQIPCLYDYGIYCIIAWLLTYCILRNYNALRPHQMISICIVFVWIK